MDAWPVSFWVMAGFENIWPTNEANTSEIFIRRLLKNYCFVLLTNRAPPQISDNRPDMRHRA